MMLVGHSDFPTHGVRTLGAITTTGATGRLVLPRMNGRLQ